MSEKRRALIVGGSIGGLFAGLLLRRAGWDVTLFERSAGDLADRGAGLGVAHELFEVMIRVGIKVERSLAFPVHSSAWIGQDDHIVFESDRYWYGSAWPIIYQPLRKAFPTADYRPGMNLVRVEQDENSVTAVFADGSRERGDLLVAADGVFSTVRRQFLPSVEPRSAGYIAWRGIVPESEMSPEAHKAPTTTRDRAIAGIISSGIGRRAPSIRRRFSPTQPAARTASRSRRR
jgi:2-polyprenyl-6-methoxyphenol hydroxylase-like FAD-dependent oxidoreductase